MRSAAYQPFPMLPGARGQVWRYKGAYRRPRHFHHEPELNLVAAGTAAVGVGEAVVEVQAGDLICFAPGQDHVLLRASPELVLFAVGCRPDVRVAAKADAGDPAGMVLPMRVHLFEHEAAPLVALAAELAGRPATPEQLSTFWAVAQQARVAAASGSPLHALTRRALAALAAHPDLDRRGLARLGGTGPTEIGRHFRRDLGLTLVDYRTRLRLLRFIAQVDRGGGDLLDAALEAGFGSYSQLHRTFRAALGCCPSRFFGQVRVRMEEEFEPVDVSTGLRTALGDATSARADATPPRILAT